MKLLLGVIYDSVDDFDNFGRFCGDWGRCLVLTVSSSRFSGC